MPTRIRSYLSLCAFAACFHAHAQDYTENFPLAECDFVPWGGNAYFALTPGRVLEFDNQECVDEGECDELEAVVITWTDELREVTVPVDGEDRTVSTRVIEERETADGELAEVSRNFFATCLPAGDVYYFGEDVEDYEDGEVVGSEGAWLAGVDNAQPGIIMPNNARLLGSRYLQEVAPDVALDRAEHVGIDQTLEVPAGEFDNCIEILESTPLEPDSESIKQYCPDVGLVVDDDLQLVAMTLPSAALRDPVALSGLWFDPDQSGEGFNIVVAPAGMVIYYYGHAADGARLWLISETFPVPSAFDETFTVDMRVREGGTFDAPAAAGATLEVWGTLSGSFSNCTSGNFALEGTDGDKTSQIVLLAGNGSPICGG